MNYNLATKSGRYNVARDIGRQAIKRESNLPLGTKQGVILDIRGQVVEPRLLDAPETRISQTVSRFNWAGRYLLLEVAKGECFSLGWQQCL